MESNELTVGISHDHTALRHRSILNGDGKCEVKILIIGCAEAFPSSNCHATMEVK
jgi:hypothetical protein